MLAIDLAVSGLLVEFTTLTRRSVPNLLLKDGSVDHSETSDEETGRNTLDGAEVEASGTEEGVDDTVEDRDHDDDRDRVQVLDKIVGRAIQCHTGSDSSQVTVDLGVAEPEDGEEQEDHTSVERTCDFTNEFVVPGHLLGEVALAVVAGFGDIPEIGLLDGTDSLGGIP